LELTLTRSWLGSSEGVSSVATVVTAPHGGPDLDAGKGIHPVIISCHQAGGTHAISVACRIWENGWILGELHKAGTSHREVPKPPINM